MTTSGGPESPDQADSTTTRTAARSLWEQPSFLVTVALCAVWLAVLLSGSKAAQAARPGAAILLILTLLGYAGYRKLRGWTALPTSGWLPSRQTSRRRWVGLVLYAVVVLSVAAGLATQPDNVLWTKSLNATTCGDWQAVMTDYQRNQVALTLLDYDRSQTPMPADAATDSASDYVSVITDMCRNDVGPSSLLFQSWEAVPPPPAP